VGGRFLGRIKGLLEAWASKNNFSASFGRHDEDIWEFALSSAMRREPGTAFRRAIFLATVLEGKQFLASGRRPGNSRTAKSMGF